MYTTSIYPWVHIKNEPIIFSDDSNDALKLWLLVFLDDKEMRAHIDHKLNLDVFESFKEEEVGRRSKNVIKTYSKK